jgi:hypothetical protein
MLATLLLRKMAGAVVKCVGQALKKIENVFALAFGQQFPPRK